MTTYPDLSVDIETLGTAPGSIIRTIGLVAFDRTREGLGPEMSVRLLMSQQAARGMVIDPDTFLWWLQQDEKARYAMIASEDPEMNVVQAVSAMQDFVAANCVEKVRVWAKGPSFDFVLLGDLARRFGVAMPWFFNRERCVRTIIDVGEVDLDPTHVAHNALEDARAQALAIQDGVHNLGMSHTDRKWVEVPAPPQDKPDGE